MSKTDPERDKESSIHETIRNVVVPFATAGACAADPSEFTALLPSETSWNWWAGWLWLVSAFLDRADGVVRWFGVTLEPTKGRTTIRARRWLQDVQITARIAIGACLNRQALRDW